MISLRAARTAGVPAALLLDWHLFGDTSEGFVGSLRRDLDLAGLHIVINTGSDDPADRAVAIAAGADRYSIKPAGFDASVALLRHIARELAPDELSASPRRPVG